MRLSFKVNGQGDVCFLECGSTPMDRDKCQGLYNEGCSLIEISIFSIIRK